VVRVLDPEVREIPALEYAWFDPEAEEFRVARSRPVALAVRSGERIGAAQVETVAPSPEEPVPAAPEAAEAPGAPLALTGADLAIERDPARLLAADGAGRAGRVAIPTLYAGTLLLVAFAHWDRRRRNIDPAVASRRRRARELVARVEGASALPSAEAAGEIAAALRELRASRPEAPALGLEEVLGECDARAFAPAEASAGAPLAPALHERALAAARALAEEEA
jgi:hypothetical protein